MARNNQLYIHYTAPTGVECCLIAPSALSAAKALATRPATLKSRGKVYRSPEQVPEHLHAAMAMAQERPERVIVITETGCKPLAGNPSATLLSPRQLALQGSRNAQIGDSPMSIHSLSCDDETWAQFLELGGSKWFRAAVAKAYQARQRKAG